MTKKPTLKQQLDAAKEQNKAQETSFNETIAYFERVTNQRNRSDEKRLAAHEEQISCLKGLITNLRTDIHSLEQVIDNLKDDRDKTNEEIKHIMALFDALGVPECPDTPTPHYTYTLSQRLALLLNMRDK